MRKPEQFSHVCSAQVSSGTDELNPCEGEVNGGLAQPDDDEEAK